MGTAPAIMATVYAWTSDIVAVPGSPDVRLEFGSTWRQLAQIPLLSMEAALSRVRRELEDKYAVTPILGSRRVQ